jgi:hypothetical protein
MDRNVKKIVIEGRLKDIRMEGKVKEIVVEGRVKEIEEENEMDVIMSEIAWQTFRIGYGKHVLGKGE